MKVLSINLRGEDGSIFLLNYDEETKEISAGEEDDALQEYFTAEHTVFIPESPVIDDFRKDTYIPVDAVDLMVLSLSELKAFTGIHPVWETLEITNKPGAS